MTKRTHRDKRTRAQFGKHFSHTGIKHQSSIKNKTEWRTTKTSKQWSTGPRTRIHVMIDTRVFIEVCFQQWCKWWPPCLSKRYFFGCALNSLGHASLLLRCRYTKLYRDVWIQGAVIQNLQPRPFILYRSEGVTVNFSNSDTYIRPSPGRVSTKLKLPGDLSLRFYLHVVMSQPKDYSGPNVMNTNTHTVRL